MAPITTQKLFTHPFLSDFIVTADIFPFTDEEIRSFDQELSEYEQVFLNPDVEKNLISKNELLASFAISKAENSQLTLTEAQDVYRLVVSEPTYDFIGEKLKSKQKLTQKDYDKLEFFNIAKIFRKLNQTVFTQHHLTPALIQTIHRQLTAGLDIFAKYLPEFTVYKSGHWRDNDSIRVGDYIPAPYRQIPKGVQKLVTWLKNNYTITHVAIFHTTLYALHPFNNGNKRVCRILEHVLLRGLGLNSKNLYSTSYYYHTEKQRYYKYILYSLERKNLNHFVSFIMEAIILSIIAVVKTSLETKRADFVSHQTTEEQIKTVVKPLIKHAQMQFKNIAHFTRGKMARQTLVNYLQKAVEQKILIKREAGRTTYYRLNFDAPEIDTLKKWLAVTTKKLPYIPDDLRFV